MNKEPVIKKILFTQEELDEIDKLNKGIVVPKVKTVTNKAGYSYQYTSNKRSTWSLAKRRLSELYGGTCTFCGAWPNYKVMYNVGDKNQGAWLVQRYCQSCFDKWKDTTRWKKKS